MNNNSFVLWLMGPTSAGKTTIGRAVKKKFRTSKVPIIHFDGDETRALFGKSLSFSPEDRLRNVSACVYLANKSLDAGLRVVVSALTANEDARTYVLKTVNNLVLVYLKCPLEVCIERDSRGLYRDVKEGKIDPKTLIGYEKPYPNVYNPNLTINTSQHTIDESVNILEEWLTKNGYNVE